MLIGGLVVIGMVTKSSKLDDFKKLARPCNFIIAGEQNWFDESNALKPAVEQDLSLKMDSILPIRNTWTAATLLEETLKSYAPDCNINAVSVAFDNYRDRVPADEISRWTDFRNQLDQLYALARSKIG